MLIAAVVVLLVLIAVLAIPVTLRFNVSWHGTLQQDIRMDWAFGLVRVRVPATSSSDEARPEQKRKIRRGRPRARRRKPSRKIADVAAALRLRQFRRRISRFIWAVWRSLHKNDIELRVRIGLGDPAETGQLWALLGPLAALLALVRDVSISLVPEFREAILELDSSGQVRVIPGRLVIIVIALLLSPSFWQGVRTLRGAGW